MNGSRQPPENRTHGGILRNTVFNLLYRRIAFGEAGVSRDGLPYAAARGLQIPDKAGDDRI
jgi:hypothetical protein